MELVSSSDGKLLPKLRQAPRQIT